MSTFAQTPQNDFLIVKGRPVLVTDKVQAAAIILGNRWQAVLGEWYLDTRRGIPYFQVIFVKNPNLRLIRQVFRSVILSVPPIVEILSLDLKYDASKRTLGYATRARTDTNQVIAGGTGIPFFVEGVS